MAETLIGSITYDVSMETQELLKESARVQKEAKQIGKSFEDLNAKLTATARAVQGFLAGIAIASAIKKVIDETRNAQQEQAQLAAVLQSTGENAGWSADRLNDMADALAKSSTFSAGEITQAQTRLLSYTNIVGDKVPEAMQATIDMAARLNMSMTQSAETIGRALDKPSEGMQTLRRQGFKFGEDQIALAKKLESTGRLAEAQAMVLSELNVAYGGAAAAARNTFGGAITALQNQLNDLLTGKDGLPEATQAVNDLTNVLGRGETKAAFAAITGWVVDLSRVLVTAVTNLTSFITSSEKLALLTGTDRFSKARKEAEGYSRELTNLTNKAIQMQEEIDLYRSDDLKTGADPEQDPSIQNKQAALGKLRAKIAEVQKQAQGATQALKDLANEGVKPELAGPPASAMNKPTAPNASGAKAAEDAAKKAGREAEQLRKRQAEQAKEYLKTLDEQASRVDQMTVAQRLQYDLKTGAVILAGEELKKAEALAATIDALKDAERQREVALNLQNARLGAQRDLYQQIEGYNAALAARTMGDKAGQDMINRLQIVREYTSRMRDLEDQQRNALALNTDPSRTEAIRKQYADQIAVQQEYQALALAEYDKMVQSRKTAEGDWVDGATKAWEDYLERIADVSSQANSLFTAGLQGMEDGLVRLFTTGKFGIQEFAQTIQAEAVRALVQMGIQYVKNAVLAQTSAQAASTAQVAAIATTTAAQTAATATTAATASAAAGTIAAAAAPAAGLMSIATMGKAALIGGAAMIGTMALAKAFGGNRQYGGPTEAGRLYRVNETGQPEMFTASNGSQYMMPTKNGNVTPANEVSGASGGITVIIENTGAPMKVKNQSFDQDNRIMKLTLAEAVRQVQANEGPFYRAFTGYTNVRGRLS